MAGYQESQLDITLVAYCIKRIS